MWDTIGPVFDAINSVLWHEYVLYVVLAVGVLFTLWSVFCQVRSLTHGTAVIRGKYDDKNDPGAINHFQALSAALSATVGLGNIAGVALAVALGGPGAVFWMWIVGLVGMAIKTTEVTLSMLYRNTDNPDEPHGGPMYVAQKGFEKWGLKGLGTFVGGIFVVTLIISTITGGNMFQSWAVGEITEQYFNVPSYAVGVVLALVVGAVIIGGIKRIGAVAGRIVPFMCGLYLLAALYVLIINAGELPGALKLIVVEAFNPSEATGAFLGGTAGYALLWGMKRALFSSEAGQGSSPIAHSAAKTDEPVREGIVAGLEPFIDTIVVCTLTAMVILVSGAWNRDAEATYAQVPSVVQALDENGAPKADTWTIQTDEAFPRRDKNAKWADGWTVGDDLFMIVTAHDNKNTGLKYHRVPGEIMDIDSETGVVSVEWGEFSSETTPTLEGAGIWVDYAGPSLTAHAFDRVAPGLGKWLIVLACWLFAVSTMISWSYYGEQGIVYLLGEKFVLAYKVIYCLLIIVACSGWITTDAQLDAVTALGTGVMLFANIPIMLIFGKQAMDAYRDYIRRLKSGELDATSHTPASLSDVMEGKDVK